MHGQGLPLFCLECYLLNIFLSSGLRVKLFGEIVLYYCYG